MTFDHPDAPPPCDDDAPLARLPGDPSPDAVAVSVALNRNTAALDRLAQAIEKMGSVQPPPGGTPGSGPSSPLGPPTGPPGVPPGPSLNESQVKRGKKIYAVCRTNNWDIADIGQRVTGRAVNPNSQKWSEADQVAVLNAFQEWGLG